MVIAPRNILANNGKIAAIVEWEAAGWYPEYWCKDPLRAMLGTVRTSASAPAVTCWTTKTLQTCDTRRRRHTRSNHGPFSPHRLAPSDSLSFPPLVSRSRITLTDSKPLPRGARGSRTLPHLSCFSFPFMRLHLSYSIAITGAPEVPVTIHNLDIADRQRVCTRPPSHSSRRASILSKSFPSFLPLSLTR
jgi:hypothetical protein